LGKPGIGYEVVKSGGAFRLRGVGFPCAAIHVYPEGLERRYIVLLAAYFRFVLGHTEENVLALGRQAPDFVVNILPAVQQVLTYPFIVYPYDCEIPLLGQHRRQKIEVRYRHGSPGRG